MKRVQRCLENFPSDRLLRYSPLVRILYSKNSLCVVIVAAPFFAKLIQSPPAGSAKFPVDVSKRTEAPGRRAGSFLEPLNFTSRLAIFFIFPIAVCIFSK